MSNSIIPTRDDLIAASCEVRENDLLDIHLDSEFMQYVNRRVLDVYDPTINEKSIDLPLVIREQLIIAILIGIRIGRKQATTELTKVCI